LQIITETPDISQREIAAKMDLTEDGVRYHIRKLKEKGVLHRVGSTKSGVWEIACEQTSPEKGTLP
ncbi:winged helix-turn-helix transcriptional regulator, partial [Desulfosarcina sp. OttesenSCG-928-A07]|nr:winged helix-turn-helix transcriptional regulator [Desulfosarcina sp. OttesenSCG-928-A07]